MIDDAIISFLDAYNSDTKNHRRNRMMLILIYELGMRISEVANLKLSSLHLNIDNPFATIVGKGNKTRQVPLSSKTRAHINEYGLTFNLVTSIYRAKLDRHMP